MGMLWRAEKYLAPVTNEIPIPWPSSPYIVTKPTYFSSLHYLHASKTDVTVVTIDCLTHSLVIPTDPPYTPRANTTQCEPEPTHFIATIFFFIFEARYFSS
jgi:hypothetical protein